MTDIRDVLEIFLVTYNRKDPLKKTLDFIFDESSPIKDLTITVLDNNSTDGTGELLKQYADERNNLKYLKNNRNIGGSANVARAFESATKKYVWCLCDNDCINWDNWSEIENAIKNDYDVVFVQNIKRDIGEIFCSATFVPACIYKTELLTDTVMTNIYDNCRNLFPHLPVIAKAINENKRIFISSKDTITISPNGEFTNDMYLRGLNSQEVPESRRYIFWTVCYYNSVELITDRKNQIKILKSLKRTEKNYFNWLITAVCVNRIYYNNYGYNYFQMFRLMDLPQKLKFVFAILFVHLKYPYIKKNFRNMKGIQKWEKYFEYIKEQEYIDRLVKKYKNKKIILYGAGLVTGVLFNSYNLSGLNIIAVADKKFTGEETYKGYKTLSANDINNTDADLVLFSVYQYEQVLKNLNLKKPHKCIIKKKPFVVV